MNNKTIIATVVVLVLVGIGGFALVANKPAETTQPPATVPPTVIPPTPPATPPVTLPPTSTNTVKEFTVTGSDYKFAPNVLTVNRGDRVRIVFRNTGGLHDFKIDEFNAATRVIGSGATETIEFIADKTGSFQFYCSVSGHRQMGMWGTLTVK